ncbi:MAG: hypothetical protein ACRCZI_12465 [Cetobacterium sp.]
MNIKSIGESLIHATDMRQNNLQKRQINDYLTEIIGQINRELIEAKKLGKHSIITEIPYIFDISNMDQKDSQRIIWARTIAILQNKEFTIKINTTQGKCKVKISWLTNIEQSTINQQNSILASCEDNF